MGLSGGSRNFGKTLDSYLYEDSCKIKSFCQSVFTLTNPVLAKAEEDTFILNCPYFQFCVWCILHF